MMTRATSLLRVLLLLSSPLWLALLARVIHAYAPPPLAVGHHFIPAASSLSSRPFSRASIRPPSRASRLKRSTATKSCVVRYSRSKQQDNDYLVSEQTGRDEHESSPSRSLLRRRSLVSRLVLGVLSSTQLVTTTNAMTTPSSSDADAAPFYATSRSTAEAQVTDKIYIDVKGLPADPTTTHASSSSSSVQDPSLPATAAQAQPRRIVIGLFGKDAPKAVHMLKALVSKEGLAAPCRPNEVRTLQREQLEANKVYNSCMESQDRGVTFDGSTTTIWRVVRNRRIDVGALSGRFVARQFPNWEGTNDLTHDAPGVVSVRRGSDGGFGFTIYPGNGNDDDNGRREDEAVSYLNDKHLVVGRVLEGMDVVHALNNVPVVTSAKLAPSVSLAELNPAPSRACRYGGSQLYCNEYKPLQKLSLSSTGVL